MRINNLSIEEKIGQMLCLAFHGTTMNSQIKTLVQDLKVGGLISFARNITSPNQIAKLNEELQGLAKVPLFLGLDQEGGSVRRVLSGITPLPGAMILSSGSTLEEVYKINYRVNSELRQLGFNVNFAPVADVNNNPLNPVINSRSYSDDPKMVSEFATTAALAMQSAKVVPTIKHFPGHGDTVVDSHLGLPIVNKSLEELEQIEIYPFKEALKAGIEGVMLSHVLYPALDDVYPASMSEKIVKGLLKSKLGFQGLIVTDSLTMGAIAKLYSSEEVILRAVNAGIDVLVFCGKADVNEQKQLFDTFVKLVESGRIPLTRIDESVQKILKYKEKYAITTEKFVSQEKNDYSTKETLDFSKYLYEKGITYVGQKPFVSFGKNDKVLIIFPEVKLYTLVDNENDDYQTLGKYLGFDEIIYNEDSDFNQIANICKPYDQVIFCSFNVSKDDYQAKLFSLLDKNKIIGLSLRSPYDYIHLKGLTRFLLIYEPTPYALEAGKKVLLGEVPIKGKLPIKMYGGKDENN